MTAGYSGTPLWKKLGVKPGGTLVLLNTPAGFGDELSDLPDDARTATKLAAETELAVLFCKDRATLEKQLPPAAAKLHRDGSLWISWPKKASKLFKDLTEDGVREVALPMGLVDVKVCAVNDDWSGLKLMVRKDQRKGWNA
jgi:hypothetical protein